MTSADFICISCASGYSSLGVSVGTAMGVGVIEFADIGTDVGEISVRFPS